MTAAHHSKGRGGFVLVVDENGEFAAVACAFLKNSGFHPLTASSLAEARQKMRSARADLLLVDVHLKDGDGFAFATELKKEHPQIPVILMTGTDYQVSALQKALKTGASGFLSKNDSVEDLLVAVRRVLSQAPAAAA